MDGVQLKVAVGLIALYVAAMIYQAFFNPGWSFPPGFAIIVGTAVTWLFGAPILRGVKGIRFDRNGKEKEPDES